MTLLNRLSRFFGGYADEQEQPHKTQAPAGPREKILVDDTMRERLQHTGEQILQHLEEGGESALWLARTVVTNYRPPACIPILIGRSAKPNKEACKLFERLMMSRSARLNPCLHDWDESDALIAALVEACAQHLNNRLEEINETR